MCKGTLPAAGLQLSEGKVFEYRGGGREGALADSWHIAENKIRQFTQKILLMSVGTQSLGWKCW